MKFKEILLELKQGRIAKRKSWLSGQIMGEPIQLDDKFFHYVFKMSKNSLLGLSSEDIYANDWEIIYDRER